MTQSQSVSSGRKRNKDALFSVLLYCSSFEDMFYSASPLFRLVFRRVATWGVRDGGNQKRLLCKQRGCVVKSKIWRQQWKQERQDLRPKPAAEETTGFHLRKAWIPQRERHSPLLCRLTAEHQPHGRLVHLRQTFSLTQFHLFVFCKRNRHVTVWWMEDWWVLVQDQCWSMSSAPLLLSWLSSKLMVDQTFTVSQCWTCSDATRSN